MMHDTQVKVVDTFNKAHILGQGALLLTMK